MGSGASKEQEKKEVTTSTSGSSTNSQKPYCPDCEKSQQKDLPKQDAISSKGQPCEGLYQKVDECMKQNKGQISSCTKEWDDFKTCHSQNR